MLRPFLDRQLQLVAKSSYLKPLTPLIGALDSFLYEAPLTTKKGPHIRDSVDLKRWMILVLFALLPAIFMAIWNSGLQQLVYESGNSHFMSEYLAASQSLSSYLDFALKEKRYLSILALGLKAFLPIVLVSYGVGGAVEAFFACVRRHEIAEGFLVTGILFPLVLPPTIPLWMVALGVAAGIILSKELFGGTGMNIFNPALVCRALLFFGFPSRMSGDVWIGQSPSLIAASLKKMNSESGLSELDSFTQSTPLSLLNISPDIARIHVDAIASATMGSPLGLQTESYPYILAAFEKWKAAAQLNLEWFQLNPSQLKTFVTAPLHQSGLGLASENFQAAFDFASLKYQLGHFSDGTLFFGNHMGSFGETSTLACLLGALFLLITRLASWRTMAGVVLGALITAYSFDLGAHWIGSDEGVWNAAKYTLPAYKHLLMGGLAFGLVFMATDPVSAPGMSAARWIYGALIGSLTVIIRLINPAYPEGVMLAILCANAFAPLIDHQALTRYRRGKLRV